MNDERRMAVLETRKLLQSALRRLKQTLQEESQAFESLHMEMQDELMGTMMLSSIEDMQKVMRYVQYADISLGKLLD